LTIAGSLRPARRSISSGEDLAGDPVAVGDQVGVGLGQGQDDAVGELDAGRSAHRVDGVDEVEHAAFAAQVVVERDVERDADGRGARVRA
jgi:hypothetical protein